MNTSFPEELKRDIDYAFSCFDSYLVFFPRERIRHAHICEIGPGKNLAVSLMFRCLGADKVYAVDKYLKPWVDGYHAPLYGLLAEAVLSRWPDAEADVLYACAESGTHNVEGVAALTEDAESLESVPDGSINFLCSWAVLEHLYDPPKAFARFAAVTKEGGYGLHQVDFRDHHDFTRPLEFLLHHYRWNLPPDDATHAWLAQRLGRGLEQARAEGLNADGLIRRVCGYNGNSYRRTEYDRLWRENGFTIEHFEKNMSAGDAYLDEFLPRLQRSGSPCRVLEREELDVVSGCYEVRRIQAA
ncbi:MAG: class I SAM-dependent methyltransferase [Desulfovibrio sp.]|jgi:hypothetical protein|nr:class I SAM-dependent methyltransferase [Desulfovibrio sp.]